MRQHASLDVVRALEDDPVGYSADAVDTARPSSASSGMTIPEEYGGSGMSMLDGVVVYEELGRALAPIPHFVSAVLVGEGARARPGRTQQRAEWLPPLASGEAIITPAWLEPDNGFGPAGVQVRAEADGDGFLISGTKRHVAFASSAQRLLVLARTGDGENDVDLFLVDPQAAGVTLTQKMSISSDTQYRVDLDGVRVAAADRIGAAGTGWATWERVMADGMILAAAHAIGGCDYALEITVQYSKDREQFDKPLGAFQALVALPGRRQDRARRRPGCSSTRRRGRTAVTTRLETAKLAPMAKLFACNTYRDTTAMAQQIFGGVGFTLEYDIQLYFRRAKQLQISWNDTRRCEELVAAAVLDVA